MPGLSKYYISLFFVFVLFAGCGQDSPVVWKQEIPDLAQDSDLGPMNLFHGKISMHSGQHSFLFDAKTGEQLWVPSQYYHFSGADDSLRITRWLNVIVYDAEEKKLRWKFDLSDPEKRIYDVQTHAEGYLALDHDRLFRLSGNGKLIDSLYFGKDSASIFRSGFLVKADSSLVLIAQNKRLLAIETDPLRVRWESNRIGAAMSFVTDGEKVFFIRHPIAGITAVELDSGKTVWENSYSTTITPFLGLLLDGDRLFAATAYGVYCFPTKEEGVIWDNRIEWNEEYRVPAAAHTISDGVYYVRWKDQNEIRRYDTFDGKEYTPVELSGKMRTNFVVIKDKVIYVDGSYLIAQQLPPLTLKEED